MAPARRIVKNMPNYPDGLDRVFQALADATRRDLIERLVSGPASVGELARPQAMSLPAVMQHLRVLEAAGLVRSEKSGRVRTYRIEPDALRPAGTWINAQQTDWERRLDRLGDLLGDTGNDTENGST